MRRKSLLLLVVALAACALTPGCAGLADYLDSLKDQSLECAKLAKQKYSECMAEPADAEVPPTASDGLVHLP